MITEFTLSGISNGWFEKQLIENPDALFKFFDSLHEPRFSIGQIGISRQELQNWKKNKLIEMPQESERVWSKLSFFDYCWLRLVKELREQFVPIEIIFKIKKMMFSIDESIFPQIKDGIDHLSNKYPSAEDIAEIKSELALMPAMANEFIMKYMNFFVLVIIGLISAESNAVLIIQNGEPFLTSFPENQQDKMNEHLLSFFDDSFVAIKLDRLLDEFYDNPKIKPTEYKSIFLLSEREKKVFDLLRTEGITKIKIRLGQKGKGIILIEATEQKSTEEMASKVKDLLGGEKFKNININLTNGKLVLYEETVMIKT